MQAEEASPYGGLRTGKARAVFRRLGERAATGSTIEDGPAGRLSDSIIRPGCNSWRHEAANRAAILIDADRYFVRLEQALHQARRSIWILAWDFNSEIVLCPDGPDKKPLGELLRNLAETRPQLEIRILVWSFGPIYSGRSMRRLQTMPWTRHPRIHLRYDSSHPVRGSHHQKVVCIDDEVAFAGGIDLTAKRWDTCAHSAQLALRATPDGLPYHPVHDVQMMVEGAAALALADLARERWRVGTGEEVAAQAPRAAARCWPDDLAADFETVKVAIARTQPALRGRHGHDEAFQLNRDALLAARRHIYVETQYFASPEIAEIMAARLRESDGPEIVILVTLSSRGMLERLIMGSNRDRLIRRLRRADVHGRLRVMYPVVPDRGTECEVLIHSKLLIVDDRFVRVGSSNLNNRSEGLDTECDLAVEARTDEERAAITALRARLLAEHLGTSYDTVRSRLDARGSMVAVIDQLNTGARGLRPIPAEPADGSTAQIPGTGFMDPKKPYWPLQKLRRPALALAAFLGR